MAKRKKDNSNLIWGIGFIVLAIVLFYMGSQGWFNFIINVPTQNQTLTVIPTTQTPVYSSCSQVCSNQGFSKSYTFINSCKEGETKVTYGYSGQNPLLTCCCFNEAVPPTTKYYCCQAMGLKSCYQNSCPPAGIQLGVYNSASECQANCQEPTSTCTDSDGGINYDVGGKVTTNLGVLYDTCQPNGMDLLEFYCEGGIKKNSGIGCVNGCIDSPTGDYCSPTKIWHAGDTVFSGSGTGTLVAMNQFALLDLSEYGITVGGTCRLGAQIQTSWSYDNPVLCTGVWGMEGAQFDFHDSNGLEYSRIDATPISLGIDLNPSNGHNLEWDGVTLWRGEVSKFPNVLPQCILHYEYSLRVYIYDC